MPVGGPAQAAKDYVQGRSRDRLRGSMARSDYVGLFPLLEPEDVFSAIRILTYNPGMSGGFGWTRRDVLEMPLDEWDSHAKWLGEQRERESAK